MGDPFGPFGPFGLDLPLGFLGLNCDMAFVPWDGSAYGDHDNVTTGLSVDRLLFSQPGQAHESILLRDRDSPHRSGHKLKLDEALAHARAEVGSRRVNGW
jgi:hypothetical protein